MWGWVIEGYREIVNSKVSFSVHNVRKIRFWKDKWYNGRPL